MFNFNQERARVCLLSAFLSLPLSVASQTADPMRAPTHAEILTTPESKVWRVSAILLSKGRRLAMINNRLYREGNMVNGARINAIYGHAVELDIDGKKLLIPPIKPEIRQ